MGGGWKALHGPKRELSPLGKLVDLVIDGHTDRLLDVKMDKDKNIPTHM